MKKIAIIFSNAPYGNNLGQDGINFALSASCYTKNVSLFFISDGIFQLFNLQNPKFILFKNYFNSFKFLKLYNMNKFYLCYDCLINRGFNKNINLIFKVNILNIIKIRKKINKYDCILNF